VSRLAQRVWSAEERNLLRKLRYDRVSDTRDLRLMGLSAGTRQRTDQAVQLVPKIYDVMADAPDPASTDVPGIAGRIKNAIG
jgi:flagellum-specific ATP synthase